MSEKPNEKTKEVSANVGKEIIRKYDLKITPETTGPPCDVCGSETVQNGMLIKCFSCGNSIGCS